MKIVTALLFLSLLIGMTAIAIGVVGLVRGDPSCMPGFYWSIGFCWPQASGSNGGGSGTHGVTRT